MELDAIKLADLLSRRSKAVLICKRNSFVERLCTKGNYSFACESIAFINKNFSLSMLMKTRSLLEQYAVKNVVYFGASELKTLYFAFAGKDLNVVVRHGTTKSRAKRDWFHRLVYSCVDYHVAISKHLLNNVRQIVPTGKNERFKIIYPSFSFADYQRSNGETLEKIHIIHVGRVARGKGHIDAVRACRVLYDKGLNFELLFLGETGDKSYMDEIKRLLKDLPYAERVKFAGYVEDVGKYLVEADIFLYPSYGEGFGNVFVEAMASGLSLVSYKNTTFPEFRAMGFRFRMAEDRNIHSLSIMLLQAVECLASDQTDLRSNARLAAELFNKERELNDWCSILV